MKNLKTIMAVCGLIVVMSSCQRGSGCPMGISEVNTQNERSCEMTFTKVAAKEIEVSE